MATTRRTMLRTVAQSGIGLTLAGSLGNAMLGREAHAQAQGAAARSSLVDKINANTLMILTTGSGLTPSICRQIGNPSDL